MAEKIDLNDPKNKEFADMYLSYAKKAIGVLEGKLKEEKKVRYIKKTDEKDGQHVESRSFGMEGDGWETMDKKGFMKMCEEFWDNHMTHCDDFDIFEVELKREPQ